MRREVLPTSQQAETDTDAGRNVDKNEKRKSFSAYGRVYVASLPFFDPVEPSQTRVEPLNDCTWISVFTRELLHRPVKPGSAGLTGERPHWPENNVFTQSFMKNASR